MNGIAVHNFGERGPHVILIHGWCCDGDFWREQIGALSPRHRVAALDFSAPSVLADRFSLPSIGSATAAIVRDIAGSEPATLIGHSLGGAIALEAAVRLGAQCRRVVGVDTFTDAAFYGGHAASAIDARLAHFRDDFSGAMEAMVDHITLAGGTDLKRSIARAMGAADPAAALVRMRALLAWDIAKIWPSIRVAVATINSAPLSRGIRRVELPGLVEVAIDDVGHFPMLEAPDRFNAALLEMLGEP